MLWQDDQLSAIAAALGAARSGQPAVLRVLGKPGMGKTSLLREIATRASGFNVLEADGQESAYREPFDLLRQLGVRDIHIPGGTSRDPRIATQGLRHLVDTLSPTRPVLILVDDLHRQSETPQIHLRRPHTDTSRKEPAQQPASHHAGSTCARGRDEHALHATQLVELLTATSSNWAGAQNSGTSPTICARRAYATSCSTPSELPSA